jgi:hypothetical protein
VFAFKAARIELNPVTRAKLMDAYLNLKPFPDSVGALKAMPTPVSVSPMYLTLRQRSRTLV